STTPRRRRRDRSPPPPAKSRRRTRAAVVFRRRLEGILADADEDDRMQTAVVSGDGPGRTAPRRRGRDWRHPPPAKSPRRIRAAVVFRRRLEGILADADEDDRMQTAVVSGD